MKNIKFKQLLQILFAVVITAVILRTFVIDSFIVEGDSMAPTILSGDYIFIDKISHHFKNFSRKDIIVVNPRSDVARIIKRIIGLPGERVEITNDRVWIKSDRKDAGNTLSEEYLNLPATPAIGLSTIQLDPKEYFILGDNRYVSIDSRELGPVDEWDIEGRVFFVFRLRSLFVKIF